mmetsp:Transcript_6467/g.5772  ORF Transcript_6467/g.5772 Transcript_6467/m.5772 type:complete len:130 (+) Transcript_6467:3-392(+)
MNSTNFSLRKSTRPRSLAPLQKSINNPHFHRPIERFKPTSLAHSGVNPNGGFIEFTRKDILRNIDVHKDNKSVPLQQARQGWPSGTTKCTFNKVNESGVLDRSVMESMIFPRNPTDNVSFDPPAMERSF